jgi:hypothetical protein
MKKIFIAIGCLATLNTQAQFTGLLKKAKDKVVEKKEATKASSEVSNPTTGTSNNNARATYNTETNTHDNTALQTKDAATKSITNVNGKIIFGTAPFTTPGSSSVSSFKSNQYIYGQLQLQEGSLKDIFKITEKTKQKPYYFFSYLVEVWKNNTLINSNNNIWNTCYLPDAAINKNFFNFDVLPSPDNMSTVISSLDNFTAGVGAAPLYTLIRPEGFSEDGEYTVKIQFNNRVSDAWGKEIDIEKWPTIASEFTFQFNDADINNLVANSNKVRTKAANYIETAVQPMPEQWKEQSSPLVMGITQPKLIEMLRNVYANKLNDYNFIKLHASNANGGWFITKNEFGVPLYRYSSQWYTIFMKGTGGKLCFYQGFGLRQNYEGGGKYTASFIDELPFRYISCDEMK